jgi:hypothetical protein
MTYVSNTRQQRRLPTRVGRAYPLTLGDDDGGFSWGGFFTDIGKSAASGAASAGIARLTQAVAPKPATAVKAAPAAAGAALAAAGIPIWGWAVGGMGLVLILVMAMRR